MSMIAAATLASCSKDDSDNKIDNNNNSVVEVEKTVENGVKETVENSVETISCPVTITVNKGNSVSKVGVADDGSGEVFDNEDRLRVYLGSDLIGTLKIDNAGSATGNFTGQIQLPKSEDNTYPNSLEVTVLVSKMNSPLEGFASTVYADFDLNGAVGTYAYLSSSATLSTSTVAPNEYPSYSSNGNISLIDQTSYLVVTGGTATVDINQSPFALTNGNVLAFNGGLVINSEDLGIKDWTSAVGKKYTLDLSAVKTITLDKEVIDLESLVATYTLSATIKPSTVASATITWSSSADNIVSVDENGIVKALKNGEATITAATANGKSATCLVRVNKKEVTFTDGDNSLTLTYYAGQKISDLNSNSDNSQLMDGYSAVNNYYVKFGSKWLLKNGENYVTADDEIAEGATYTLVDQAPAASITLGNYTIFYAAGDIWDVVAGRTDNTGVLTSIEYTGDHRFKIGALHLVKDGGVVLGSETVESSIEYSLSDNVVL